LRHRVCREGRDHVKVGDGVISASHGSYGREVYHVLIVKLDMLGNPTGLVPRPSTGN